MFLVKEILAIFSPRIAGSISFGESTPPFLHPFQKILPFGWKTISVQIDATFSL
jgi:hypothetical protein